MTAPDAQMLVFFPAMGAVGVFIFLSIVALWRKALSSHCRRTWFAVSFFSMQFMGLSAIILTSVVGGGIMKPFEEILVPRSIVSGFFALILEMLYLVELKRPGWITAVKAMLCSLPFLLLAVHIPVIGDMTMLHSVEDVLANVSDANVILRIALTGCYFVYALAVVALPCDEANPPQRKLVAVIEINFLLLLIFFVCGIMLGIFYAFVADILLIVTFDCLVVRAELFKFEEAANAGGVTPDVSAAIFDDPRVWKRSDITVGKLCEMTGLSRTDLACAIRMAGYDNFYDMINRKRVEFIRNNLTKENAFEKGLVSRLIAESGFRTRSAAYLEFRKIRGCSPAQYLKSRLD